MDSDVPRQKSVSLWNTFSDAVQLKTLAMTDEGMHRVQTPSSLVWNDVSLSVSKDLGQCQQLL